MNTKIHFLSKRKQDNAEKSIVNISGYRCLAFFSMAYISLMLFNAILTNRYIGTNSIFVLGGTFTSPFVFLLDNIIAEIYGFKITRSIILFGIIAQTFFILLCQLVLLAPHPDFFTSNPLYEQILGVSLLRIHLSGCAAYIFAMLFNTKVITHWKVLLKGRKFWLRSLGACTISEALYSFVAILLMELQSIPLTNVFKVILLSYTIKMSYNVLLVIPAQIIVYYTRRITKIDVYDFNKQFSVASYLKLRGSI